MIIGITGYVGAGKSTVAEIFGKHGYAIIDCDSIGHEILATDREVQQKLIALYGQTIISRDLKIDREKLAEIVFSDQEKIENLNRIIHPKLKVYITALLEEYRKRYKNIIIDAAILKELGLEEKVDKIILVKTDLDKMYDRLKRKYTQKLIINIMNKQQLPKNYDFVINNKGNHGDLQKHVLEIMKKL